MRRKELLEAECAKLREYLTMLEKQKQAIETDNPEAAIAYCEFEVQILAAISDYQKITPLTGDSEADKAEISKQLAELRELMAAVVARNLQNRELLTTKLVDTQSQLDSLKNPYRNTRSIYANSDSGATILIEA
jgi:flagellar biosynthesis/type III secretory pathway chaperone